MSENITKPTAIKRFFKENTNQRLSKEAIPIVLDYLNELTLSIAKKSEEICKLDDRSTILDRDVVQAFESIGGGIDNPAEGLFGAIAKMNPEEIGKVSLLISEWVKENRRKLNMGK